ncbi:hypothetical protein ACIGGE_08495 [Qipengyuania sp. NPDC077410]|uniref:hypothetical protein n=1 Tax=Qipengyuania sp. NPDC077410 TaxID=3364496 RepID=UPI0037CC747D
MFDLFAQKVEHYASSSALDESSDGPWEYYTSYLFEDLESLLKFANIKTFGKTPVFASFTANSTDENLCTR